MSSVNKVFLIGRLGKDPEMRYTKDQTPFARFSLATSEVFTVNGERREKTQWHQLVAWRKTAEIAGRYLKKGKQIFVEGEIEYREFEDQSGQRRFFTDIIVDRLTMLGSAQDGGYGAPQGVTAHPRAVTAGRPRAVTAGRPRAATEAHPRAATEAHPRAAKRRRNPVALAKQPLKVNRAARVAAPTALRVVQAPRGLNP